MRTNIENNLQRVLDYLDKFIESNGYPPSVREICDALSIKSTATAFYYLNKLNERGLIEKSPSKNRALGLKRNLETKFISAPLVGEVTCGEPILAIENYEGYYPISDEFQSSGELFLLKAQGESMIDAGVLDGDKLIVQKQSTADNGDIVVAMIEDGATVKRFYKKPDSIVLHPENSAMEDMILNNVEILGKVVGLIRKF